MLLLKSGYPLNYPQVFTAPVCRVLQVLIAFYTHYNEMKPAASGDPGAFSDLTFPTPFGAEPWLAAGGTLETCCLCFFFFF